MGKDMGEYIKLLEEAAEAARALLKAVPGSAKHYGALQRLKQALAALDTYRSQRSACGTAE
jgi:hypothetical protein